MGKFAIKQSTYGEKNNPLYIYLSIETDTINPLELQKEAAVFIEYMRAKYKHKTINTNLTFADWVKRLFKS
jgi:hypothetical protein